MNKIILKFLFLGVLIIAVSCNSNESVNSNQIVQLDTNSIQSNNDSNELTNDFQSDETEIEETPMSFSEEARQEIENYLSSRYAECDGIYYLQTQRNGYYTLYQTKNKPIVKVGGEEYRPKVLSEADKLNGVDPLPISWSGKAIVTYKTARKQHYRVNSIPGFDSWEQWQDKVTNTWFISKRKDKWFLGANLDEMYPKMTCDNIPKERRNIDENPPSFGGTFPRGGVLLYLPSTYSKWFSLGKGPMSLGLTEAYSFIYLDGTNRMSVNALDERHPGGSEALVPEASLGSVVLKIGKNGKPFQLFKRKSSANTPFEVKTNDEVFIAINDVDYSDNRGTHQIIVKKGN